jgi:tetratricopeptide (TPR) repeat protein
VSRYPYAFREMMLRAIQLGEVPKLDDLISLFDEIDQIVIQIDQLDKDVEEVNVAKSEAEYRLEDLEDLLQVGNDTKEALAAEVVKLRGELEEERACVAKLNRTLQNLQNQKRKRRSRTKKEPDPAPPEVIFPTYELPKDAPNVVCVAFGTKDPERARELYNQADLIDTDPASYAQAEKLYREAIRLDPSLAVARTNLGNVRFRRGDGHEAAQCYQDALRIDSNQVEATYNLGVIHSEWGEPARSIPFYELALSICPPGDPMLADIHYNLALSLDEIGNVERARSHWKACSDLDPDSEWGRRAKRFFESTEPTVHKPHLVSIRGGRSTAQEKT